MTDVIVVGEPSERPIPGEEVTGEAPEVTAAEIVETAVEIVEVVNAAVEEAKDDGVIEVMARLGRIEETLANLSAMMGIVVELVTPAVVEEAAPEVVEVEEAPAVVVEAETIEEVAPVVEEVPVAETPQIRTVKKTRWI